MQQQQQDDGVNREQRRQAKKQNKQRASSAAAKGFASPQDAIAKVSEMTASMEAQGMGASEASTAPLVDTRASRPQTIDDLRSSSARDSEARLMAKAKEAEKGELAGYEELRKVDPAVLASTEKFLLSVVLALGGAWLLAGVAVAFDAYMVASKKALPDGFDKLMSSFVEPFLTPGIVGVFLLSGLLGLLQFYKFEGGKSASDQLNEARQFSNRAKRRAERGGGKGPL